MHHFRIARERRQAWFRGPVNAIVFDWAGTMVDHGCCAPVGVFARAFAENGVQVTEDEVRAPMGMGKREHFLAMIEMPRVRERWREKHGRAPQSSDVDAMYDRFLPLLIETVGQYGDLIPGARETFQWLRSRGVRVGSSTGYPREVAEIVAARASEQGYEPQALLTSSDFAEGRPAPWLIFENMRRLGVKTSASMVKVDDSTHGIVAGLNAGTWTVGVAASGNSVGLSAESLAALPAPDREHRVRMAIDELAAAGAHYVIDSVASLPAVIEDIDARLSHGERPD